MPKPLPTEPRRRLIGRVVFLGLFLASTWAVGYLLPIPVASALAKIAFWIVAAGLLAWLLWRAYRRLLWHVSGRLAFSYFLIGIVPIPLATILVLIVAYGLTGFYLGRIFHDTAAGVQRDLALAAATGGRQPGPALGPVEIASYRDGRRVEGSERAPETWPAWLAAEPLAPAPPPEAAAAPASAEGAAAEAPAAEDAARAGWADGAGPTWVELADGSLTLAAAVETAPGTGTLAFAAGDLEALVRERSGIWVQPADESRRQTVKVRDVSIRVPDGERGDDEGGNGEGGNGKGGDGEPPTEAAEPGPSAASAPEDVDALKRRFFAERAQGEGWTERPLLTWIAITQPPVEIASGQRAGDELAMLVQASPRMVARSLFGQGAELVASFWIALLAVSLMLLTIYAVAELVAIAMIVGLSRAVSRLYAATSRVASGDFSVRIPVRRRDQVGALQRSFNAMAENLQDLVATAAQTELLEKELEIARQIQQSLIPQVLPGGDTVEFSTLFEPSAAIGGDYFDVLRLSDDELAVVVADVSGHGLPTGLRMAMVKAALGILVVETREADEILRRLDATVRSGGGAGEQSRFFVTAVFSRVDFRRGVIELTNAGHPPAYRVRDGGVEEILVAGSPLGGLGHTYGRRRIELAAGDVMVWLSDGLIEATDGEDEPFGYDRVEAALAGPAESAAQVRDRLLAAVEAHTGGRPAEDDRTVVVMRYTGS
ncbi:MAG TPA: SpoIIE family protein phosphatase [Thermoanaerobaculia bacterium]|nr:SpoIIE family protein phosphatase [Thermoanaerobaculia bacterium]